MEPRGGRHPAWVQGARQGPLTRLSGNPSAQRGVLLPVVDPSAGAEPSSQVDREAGPVHQVPLWPTTRSPGPVTSGATSGAAVCGEAGAASGRCATFKQGS